MEQPEPLHPAHAEAIAEFAEETGVSVLRGVLRYPSESGGWQLGDTDLSEHLGQGSRLWPREHYCLWTLNSKLGLEFGLDLWYDDSVNDSSMTSSQPVRD